MLRHVRLRGGCSDTAHQRLDCHPEVLSTRSNIAGRTGECGDSAGALRLFRELLPDQERVLGGSHPAVLAVRGRIEGLARAS
jgi:hypothetical protein